MRFFILALCINLILLALPLNIQKDIKTTTNQTKITIALQESKPMVDEILPTLSEPIALSEHKEEVQEKVQKVEEALPPKPIQKTPLPKKPKPIKKQKQSKVQNKQVVQQEPIDTAVTQSNEMPLKSSNVTQTNEIFSINDSFCKKNVVFADIDSSYPKKAKMLKKNGTFDVVVRFSVNDKSIKIIDIKGDKLFVEHTKKLFKNLNYKVNDKRAYECVFVKTIRFESGK